MQTLALNDAIGTRCQPFWLRFSTVNGNGETVYGKPGNFQTVLLISSKNTGKLITSYKRQKRFV